MTVWWGVMGLIWGHITGRLLRMGYRSLREARRLRSLPLLVLLFTACRCGSPTVQTVTVTSAHQCEDRFMAKCDFMDSYTMAVGEDGKLYKAYGRVYGEPGTSFEARTCPEGRFWL